MIVDKVRKLTNTVRVGLDARSSHAQRQSTFPDNVCSYCPPCHGVCHSVSHYENLTTFVFFLFLIHAEMFLNPRKCSAKNGVMKTNTGGGGKGKRGRTASDDAGGKSLSETSKSARGQCVGESSTGAKSAESFRGCSYEADLAGHCKSAQRMCRVISACLCPISTQKH
jgi:hypothetical protein